jgi:hypothetical protein
MPFSLLLLHTPSTLLLHMLSILLLHTLSTLLLHKVKNRSLVKNTIWPGAGKSCGPGKPGKWPGMW